MLNVLQIKKKGKKKKEKFFYYSSFSNRNFVLNINKTGKTKKEACGRNKKGDNKNIKYDWFLFRNP